MVSIQAFRALRPVPERAADIASPPYDVVSAAQARAMVARCPESFMGVLLPEGPDPHALARQRFRGAIERGLFLREAAPALYIYRLTRDGRSQTGLAARCSVADYEQDRIKKHEHVRPAKVEDRCAQFLAVGAQTGPVFLACERPSGGLDLDPAGSSPLYDLTFEDGVRHELFRVDEPERIAALTAVFRDSIDALYIADGHHRTASACAVKAARAAEGSLSAEDPAHGFLAVIFPGDELQILPYNRAVAELGEGGAAGFLSALQERFEVVSSAEHPPLEKGRVSIFLDGSWRTIDVSGGYGERPEQRLDAYALQELVLGPMLGIADPRTDERLSFWGGDRDPKAMAAAVAAGEARCAFSLNPIAMADIIAVSKAGGVLPPKSTWFEPKLRSGLLVYELEAEGSR